MVNHPHRSKQQQAPHTLGPWHVVDPNGHSIEKGYFRLDGYRPISIANEKGHRVCFVGEHTKDLARARLIAAAPDLLAALKLASARLESGNEVDQACARHCRAVVAKAEGR